MTRIYIIIIDVVNGRLVEIHNANDAHYKCIVDDHYFVNSITLKCNTTNARV